MRNENVRRFQDIVGGVWAGILLLALSPLAIIVFVLRGFQM